jgi:hypothetical protein
VREEKTMERYLNTPIKEIISKFPKVGEILEAYEIGCVPCTVGSCLLKDIIEVHNLSEEGEREVMARIAKVIYPDKIIPIPQVAKSGQAKQINFPQGCRRACLIKRWIALIHNSSSGWM